MRLAGNRLLTGIAVTIPILVTYWVLSFAYGIVNGISAPIFHAFGIEVPGLGFLTTLVVMVSVGFMAAHVIGRRVIDLVERLLLRVPIVATIYAATKQVLDSFSTLRSGSNFKSVVLVEYLTEGSYLVAFATGQLRERDSGREMVMVFVPTAPNPMTGFVIAVPRPKVIECDLTLEEATKLLVSAGLITPGRPVVVGRTPVAGREGE